jgi:hypothetical protein
VLADLVGQSQGGSLTATVGLAVNRAQLSALRRVDPKQPDALPRISIVSPSMTEARPSHGRKLLGLPQGLRQRQDRPNCGASESSVFELCRILGDGVDQAAL